MGDGQRRLQDAAAQLNHYAFRHAIPILIAPRNAAPDGIHGASGFFARLGAGIFLGTAWHVVDYWIQRRGEAEPVLFQLSDTVALDPEANIAWRDEQNDIVFVSVTDAQVAAVGASVCEPLPTWPPLHPIANADVFVAGFPGQIRLREGVRDITFRSLCAHVIVQETRANFVVCALDTDYLIAIDGTRIPLAELDLGGMSGGPVFFVGQLAYPLVALVSEFAPALGIIRLATLSQCEDLVLLGR